jgi:hypothetical protein
VSLAELRNLDDAKAWLLAGLATPRTAALTAVTLPMALAVVLETASQGEPILPVAFVIDLTHILLGRSRAPFVTTEPRLRHYDDDLLGKLDADWTIERAADAIKAYAPADRIRGIAYVARQLRHRLGIAGTSFSPAVVRTLVGEKPDAVLAEIAQSPSNDLAERQRDELVSAFRRAAELLGPDDVAALEQRTALADLGQYVAHRQIVQMTTRLGDRLPTRPVRPRAGRRDVPTKVRDDDHYPVGGYSSIGTKGSIESLLHSQLAFLEPGRGPDLFAIRFVRDELFYYSRDENQFLRRRRTFAIVLDPSLAKARFKDAEAPVQRIVFALTAVVLLARTLDAWLTADALTIDLVGPPQGLEHEWDLLAVLLRPMIERGTVRLFRFTPPQIVDHLDRTARASESHALVLGNDATRLDREGTVGTMIDLAEPTPTFTDSRGDFHAWTDDDAESAWVEAIVAVLAEWV